MVFEAIKELPDIPDSHEAFLRCHMLCCAHLQVERRHGNVVVIFPGFGEPGQFLSASGDLREPVALVDIVKVLCGSRVHPPTSRTGDVVNKNVPAAASCKESRNHFPSLSLTP